MQIDVCRQFRQHLKTIVYAVSQAFQNFYSNARYKPLWAETRSTFYNTINTLCAYHLTKL